MTPTVQLLATCLIEHLRPEAGLAVVTVLERLGVQVHVPEGQTCCGQPAFNAGAWDDARAMARHTLDVLNRSDASIVVPSGSCTDMIVHQYPRLFADEPTCSPLAQAVAARTYEFSQYLVEVLGVKDVAARFAGKVTYHPSCHLLRGLGIVQPPQELLAHVADADVVELPGASECCGFGGLFALKMSAISSAMLQRKLDAIAQAGAQTVVACDVSCLLHIGGGLHRRGANIATRHLAEVLAGEDRP
jgi:L-lactate dehydrogenase complex protein LldE